MKKVFFLMFFLLLSACGGGGGSMGDGKLLKTKVIDGYISGANIFLDMNWNLQQDINEPSAYEDTEEQFYYFLEEDFSAIENFSLECARNRPRIANIPVGAVDSDTGVVNEAYQMHFFPYYSNGPSGEQGEYRANVTPLTSLFMIYVTDQIGNTNISDVDGCKEEANAVASRVIPKVIEVLGDLSSLFGINPSSFYEDFIESGNEQLKQYAIKIVSFLQMSYKVSYLLEQEYGVSMRTQVDRLLVEAILNETPISTTRFALFSESPREYLSDGYYSYDLFAFYEVFSNEQGQLTDSSGQIIDLNFNNLKANTSFQIREITTIDNAIFDSNKVLFEKGESTNLGNYRFVEFGTFLLNSQRRKLLTSETETQIYKTYGAAQGLSVIFRNQNNPNFDLDLQAISESREVSELEQIYNEIDALSSSMSTIENNRNLLFLNDYQQLVSGDWLYTERQESSLVQECINISSNQVTTGSDGYNLCSQHID